MPKQNSRISRISRTHTNPGIIRKIYHGSLMLPCFVTKATYLLNCSCPGLFILTVHLTSVCQQHNRINIPEIISSSRSFLVLWKLNTKFITYNGKCTYIQYYLPFGQITCFINYYNFILFIYYIQQSTVQIKKIQLSLI